MIRTIFVWFCIVADTLVLGSLVMVVYLFDRSGRTGHSVARLWARVIVWASGVRVKTEGLEHVQDKGPYLFMSNHQGAYDIFALEGYLPFHFKWLAKKELFFIPVLGWAMAAAGYISIDREGTRETVRAMNEAARKIQEGMSVVIFPEGSRSPDGSIQPFKKGGFTLAIKSRVPIIPVSITGSREVMPKEKRTVASGEIRIRIDAPIETRGYSLKDRKLLMEKVRQTISKNFELISGKRAGEAT
ncbi:MAG: lysophospholipid acyltransferase family protein [Thermodesulfobacteriota bacterium]